MSLNPSLRLRRAARLIVLDPQRMMARRTPALNPYHHFSKPEWSKLRDGQPMTLTQFALTVLSSLIPALAIIAFASWRMKSERYVLAVARLAPQKGIDVLLEAFANLGPGAGETLTLGHLLDLLQQQGDPLGLDLTDDAGGAVLHLLRAGVGHGGANHPCLAPIVHILAN